MINNQFDNLSAENGMHNLAQVGAEESPEYNDFLAKVEAQTPPPEPVKPWDLLNSIHAEMATVFEDNQAKASIMDAIGATA
jgi:hypothetical protein